MFDTVYNWLPKEMVRGTDLLSEITPLLTDVHERYSHKTESIKITGNFKNYKVSISEHGVSVKGSICKYFLSNNMQTLDRKTTKEAFTKLSDELHLPIYKANVTRIDVAENFVMLHAVPVYLDYLGEARHYRRLPQNNGVTYRYQSDSRVMVFYGKVPEQIDKGVRIPDMFKDKNMLRYEHRLQGRLCKQLNLPEVKTFSLYNEKIYSDILSRWRSEYFKIHKYKLHNFDLNFLSDMKEFEKQIFLLGINSLGGEAALMQLIEQAKGQGVFANRMQEKRIKDKVKHLCSTPKLSYESDVILELDKKVKEAATYYR